MKKSLIALSSLLLSAAAFSQQVDFTDKSLEDLMNIQVTSVSKKEQSLSHAASAIFVISAEDIARSGATNIPDLLRMVPGVDVAQINADTWAINARGLNALFSNQLLVLVDGRNIYTPTFGGVLWDTLDLPLEDIERIEVIRGPGGTIWGANAVNGVINIIMKKAAETPGGLLVGGGGNLDQAFGMVQYGGRLGTNTDFRVSTKYFNQDHLPSLTGMDGNDAWHLLRAGFRSDSTVSLKDSITVAAAVYTGKEGSPELLQLFPSPVATEVDRQVGLSGGYLQSEWKHVYSARSDTALQISFDRYKRTDNLTEDRKTLAIDFQHHVAWGNRQDIVWGAGYSFSNSKTLGDFNSSLDPADFSMQLFNTFVQDEVALIPDKLYVTVGTKLEHNVYTGLNFMPSVRMAWTPNHRSMLWAAVANAARTPAESDVAVRANVGTAPAPGPIPILVAFVGNPLFKNERLIAYDLGYRIAFSSHVSMDTTAFYNDYTHQQTIETGTPFFATTPAPAHLVVPVSYANLLHGEAHGLETAVNWKVTDRWTLSPGYAFEQIHTHVAAASTDAHSVLDTEGNTPVHSAQLRSHFNLAHGFAWDASAYFVDRLRSGNVPSYTRLDTGFSWQLTKALSLKVVGQNLVRDRHLEFVDDNLTVQSTLIKRSAYAKFTWHF